MAGSNRSWFHQGGRYASQTECVCVGDAVRAGVGLGGRGRSSSKYRYVVGERHGPARIGGARGQADSGRYNLVELTPGRYKMTVDGGGNFASFESDSVVVTVGENATLNPRLELRGMSQTVTVTSETAAI